MVIVPVNATTIVSTHPPPSTTPTTAGHTSAAAAAADTSGALSSLAGALLARAAALRASLSGRDLSGAIHAAGKLAAVRFVYVVFSVCIYPYGVGRLSAQLVVCSTIILPPQK